MSTNWESRFALKDQIFQKVQSISEIKYAVGNGIDDGFKSFIALLSSFSQIRKKKLTLEKTNCLAEPEVGQNVAVMFSSGRIEYCWCIWPFIFILLQILITQFR